MRERHLKPEDFQDRINRLRLVRKISWTIANELRKHGIKEIKLKQGAVFPGMLELPVYKLLLDALSPLLKSEIGEGDFAAAFLRALRLSDVWTSIIDAKGQTRLTISPQGAWIEETPRRTVSAEGGKISHGNNHEY
jgi:hypothetical protein